MQFIHPLFLLALFTLIIPVLVHLFNFRKYQKVYFSNVQFLHEIQEQQASRRNLKERLVLAARMLALTFLVLAFARPYIPEGKATNAGRQNIVSIFVDNSYSMQTLNSEGSLLEQAKRSAKQIAAGYHINDRFQLLTQDFEGKHQRLMNRDEFIDAVDAVKISPQSRQLQQIINRQQSLLAVQPGALKTVVIISDFQKNMLSPSSLKTDTGININLIQIKSARLPNIAVDSVALLSAVHRPGETERVVIKLHNYGDQKAEKVPLKLSINGEPKGLGSYTLGANEIQTDTLVFSGLQSGWQEAMIRLQDNPVTFDNEFYFSFNVLSHMPVMLIDGGTPDPFLKAVFATDAFFDVQRVEEGNIDYARLSTYGLIVASGIKSFSPGTMQQLRSYVTRSGQLAVFPAEAADINNYRAFLQSVGAAYPQKLIIEPNKVSTINLQNPLFKDVFESFPQNPDLPLIKKYYQLSTGSTQLMEKIMSMENGQSFWAGYRHKKGRVYVAAVPLNDDFSNLPKHALFVPIMLRMALLSRHSQPLFYTLGANESFEIAPVETSGRQVLKLTKGPQTIIPDARQVDGLTQLFVSDQVRSDGIYTLKRQDSVIAKLAFNNARKESDMHYLSDAQLKQMLPGAHYITGAPGLLLNQLVAETNFGLQLWKLCIILALIFMAAEIVLVKYYHPRKSRVSAAADQASSTL